MTNCDICGGFLIAAESLSCSKCLKEFHLTCLGDDIIDENCYICGDCNSSQKLGVGESSGSQQVGRTQSAGAEIHSEGLNRELTCILFPGVVKNVDKALQCLGGIKNISQIYSQATKKRLGLCFQPENPFIKKIYADKAKTAGVLLKVRIKKVKVNNEVKREVISTDVVGRVSNIYRFESMCDFQYLPIERETPDGPMKCIIEDIIPSGCDTLDFFKDSPNTCSYIVPASFTRSDKPICYAYTDKRYPDKSGSPSGDNDYHNKSRSDRGLPQGHWWRFNLTDDFPAAPNELYFRYRDVKADYNPALLKEYEIVEKCFQDRPIWSLNMVRYVTKLRLTSLKVLVPCVAVFMKDGPWRSLWVRYGFDPRKEPSSVIYQTLDFRLRHTAGVHTMVTTRDQLAHYKSTLRVRNIKRKNRTELLPGEDILEGAVIFRPGMAPTQRQIFYQLCDVKLPEVEQLLATAHKEAGECHEKLGWLPPNALEQCRDHISRYVKDTLLASHSELLKYEEGDVGSSESDDGSGDDITDAMDESMIQ